ncbi:transglycosylase SLT domain-containing protein [Commensalibacter communis]|uniref:transglycosylase SLT domain-containing protein n=1 Tax=Commensalibacter communis TaxID=2972786 RepID=UPI0022FFA9DC|nr:transglycosylase SLT domain-containing protein [Commensalibacter communis]CAI3959130.1 unnamed protein product [Commensalibacter communis]CAI3959250.1 unnamed protein product [Commensalibacter communis]
MPTHQHAKSKKPHAKPHKPSAKQTKPFAKPQKPHVKQKSSIPLLTVALLQEIRSLVETNNKSKQSTEMVICQIYKESSFNKNTGKGGNGAKGLMQLRKNAVAQLFQERYEKEHGTITKEHIKILKQVHKQGQDFHNSEQMFDAATNIRYGTEYLQSLIDKNGISAGYQKYRGNEEFDYYSKIKACAAQLKNNPNSLGPLIEMNEKKKQ